MKSCLPVIRKAGEVQRDGMVYQSSDFVFSNSLATSTS